MGIDLDFRTRSRTLHTMRTLSSTELRANLSSIMDRVSSDHEPVIVTRAGGEPVVIVSLEDWASMDETAYLLASPENRRQLRAALDEAEPGQQVIRSLDQLKAMETP